MHKDPVLIDVKAAVEYLKSFIIAHCFIKVVSKTQWPGSLGHVINLSELTMYLPSNRVIFPAFEFFVSIFLLLFIWACIFSLMTS